LEESTNNFVLKQIYLVPSKKVALHKNLVSRHLIAANLAFEPLSFDLEMNEQLGVLEDFLLISGKVAKWQ
jgi:hypothetical protein